VVTLFIVKKWRTKLSAYLYLMWWHLRLCPETMGLNRERKSETRMSKSETNSKF
jgi:hypothetical protein